jgi:hypothetical protein
MMAVAFNAPIKLSERRAPSGRSHPRPLRCDRAIGGRAGGPMDARGCFAGGRIIDAVESHFDTRAHDPGAAVTTYRRPPGSFVTRFTIVRQIAQPSRVRNCTGRRKDEWDRWPAQIASASWAEQNFSVICRLRTPFSDLVLQNPSGRISKPGINSGRAGHRLVGPVEVRHRRPQRAQRWGRSLSRHDGGKGTHRVDTDRPEKRKLGQAANQGGLIVR